jgi:hypothetical protein
MNEMMDYIFKSLKRYDARTKYLRKAVLEQRSYNKAVMLYIIGSAFYIYGTTKRMDALEAKVKELEKKGE